MTGGGGAWPGSFDTSCSIEAGSYLMGLARASAIRPSVELPGESTGLAAPARYPESSNEPSTAEFRMNRDLPTDMPALNSCARCGAELRPQNSEGLCTRCLLESGLDEPVVTLPGQPVLSLEIQNRKSKIENPSWGLSCSDQRRRASSGWTSAQAR